LQSGNILFDVQAEDIVYSQPQGARDSVIPTDGYVSLPSKPLQFSDKQPVKAKITDFGVGQSFNFRDSWVANWVDKHWLWLVQPDGYRAPEVILDAPWSTPIDIWSFGCIVFPHFSSTQAV
jgi:serine/threonine protein kinase